MPLPCRTERVTYRKNHSSVSRVYVSCQLQPINAQYLLQETTAQTYIGEYYLFITFALLTEYALFTSTRGQEAGKNGINNRPVKSEERFAPPEVRGQSEIIRWSAFIRISHSHTSSTLPKPRPKHTKLQYYSKPIWLPNSYGEQYWT